MTLSIILKYICLSRPQGLEKSPSPRTVESADHADQEGDSADRLGANNQERDAVLKQKTNFHVFPHASLDA